MGSPFDGLSTEIPSVIVDRVLQTVLASVDADFLAFFTAAGGAAGSSIKIIQRVDPIYDPKTDDAQTLLLWGLSQGRSLLVGGGKFLFGVGWRMVYREAPRFRSSGDPDAGSLVWKFRRALWANIPLNDSLSQDPKADRIEDFRAVRFEGLEYPNNVCVDVIEGSVTYERTIDKDSI